MNRIKLKNYAPQARRDFIQAMTDRAAFYGLAAKKIEPVVERGDVAVIAGREHPRPVAKKRKQLEDRIQRHGFAQTMEAIAYTWFNRLVALRYMEIHGFLDHGYRVLSGGVGRGQWAVGREDPTADCHLPTADCHLPTAHCPLPTAYFLPEILEHAEHVELPGLKKEAAIDLKLAGNKEAELYRLLLTAQCNALNTAMPFLFEKIDDETELLLPDNLLHSDSLICKLVSEIDEEDWQEVEIIGWLYQFYISEKKAEVIGKVVASEDIPAATQLFTPNWIVKYLVQNTLGRQWLATYPESALRQQMPYYIEPAEQTPEVQEQLKAITPTSLNPEHLTLLDPACGSGHILVGAYDLFKTIYQERGYRAKDIPALILQKNLFGLEIDDRAAQLSAFALMMKARADDRRIFDNEAKPNVLAFEESQGMNAADITHALNSPVNKEELRPSEYLIEGIEDAATPLFSKMVLAEKGHVSQTDIASLLTLFENAKTFGSLIQVPPQLAAKLPEIEHRLNDVLNHGDLTHAPAHVITPLLQQAQLLARQYDAVVANPPYMGSKYFTGTLKDFVADQCKAAKADLYACFILRNMVFTKPDGFVGMITIPNWMFLSSFEDVRTSLFGLQTIDTFIHSGRGVFGSDFGSCAFVYRNYSLPEYRGTFRRLFEKQGSVASNEELIERFHSAKAHTPANADFAKIPGGPIAYWVSDGLRGAFARFDSLERSADVRQGLATADDERFLRLWHEVDYASFGRNGADSTSKWFPFNKGGAFRRWYGNRDYVVNWKHNGHEILNFVDENNRQRSRPQNRDYYFREGITWSLISISLPSFRLFDSSFIFGHKGPGVFATRSLFGLVAFLNSSVSHYLLQVLSPSVGFEIGQIELLPVCEPPGAIALARSAVDLHRSDWDSFETSWDFQTLPVFQNRASLLQESLEAADAECIERLAQAKVLEEENNRVFINAYGLQDELDPEVADAQITLYRPDREEDIKRLLSYAIGSMMGRFSLDKPGLIYARSGNQGFDSSQYKTFRADDDGIIPLFESDWGIRDDATNRVVEFVGLAWPGTVGSGQQVEGRGSSENKNTADCRLPTADSALEENLKFIADSLGPTSNEQPRDTIRHYLATGFYKHHLAMYKRRPVYWLFSSGKQRAFQCLVYLHRYHEGTLARMRTEYVIPLQGQITARIEQLEGDKAKATSTSHRNKLQKEQNDLKKQQTELFTFEEKLKHAADQKISLDLDDGVKVNYGKFGDLLAEVKAVCGSKDEE